MKECPDCHGEGRFEEIRWHQVGYSYDDLDATHVYRTCETCGGTGQVAEEEEDEEGGEA